MRGASDTLHVELSQTRAELALVGRARDGMREELSQALDALGEACHLIPTTYCSQAVDCVLVTAYCLLRIASRAASSVDCLLLMASYLLLS